MGGEGKNSSLKTNDVLFNDIYKKKRDKMTKRNASMITMKSGKDVYNGNLSVQDSSICLPSSVFDENNSFSPLQNQDTLVSKCVMGTNTFSRENNSCNNDNVTE